MVKSRIIRSMAAAGAAMMMATNAEAAPEAQSLGIEDVLTAGWEVAGYASNADNRSTFVLFKKAGEHFLIQCLVGYDVTREPHVFRNCYELH